MITPAADHFTGPGSKRAPQSAAELAPAAWKTKPSWYLVSTEDKMIPPDAQRAMSRRAGSTVAEVKASHSVYVSQPQAVASIIENAAKSALTVAAIS